MAKQHSKRLRNKPRSNIRLDLYQQTVDIRNTNGWIHRVVSEASAQDLQKASRGIRGKQLTRVAGFFSVTYIYPRQLIEARERSRLDNPPIIEEVASRLGKLSVPSLHQPVEAEVTDVSLFGNNVALSISYPELETEQKTLVGTARWMLKSYGRRLGPGTHHVSIVKGAVTKGQLAQISRHAPHAITLSPVKTEGIMSQTLI